MGPGDEQAAAEEKFADAVELFVAQELNLSVAEGLAAIGSSADLFDEVPPVCDRLGVTHSCVEQL